MADALVGHTGFVGGNLAAQHRFAACFNSKNIEAIRGRKFDTLVASAMPAAKWLANRDSLGDRTILDSLWGNISKCQAKTVVVVSTVDVYPVPRGVDEGTIIEPMFQEPYGKNRYELERRAALHFPRVLSVRLPGLYGPGLKKNAIYDLLNDNQVEKIHPDAAYQFYNLNRLWSDIETALGAGLSVVNFATEPVAMREVARAAFGHAFSSSPNGSPARYDMRTKHAELLGGRGNYMESKAEVLSGIAAYVAGERRAGEGGGVKLAVSNIAWPRDQDEAVARVLNEHGVAGIEIAPTKVWPQPLAATDAEIAAYRQFWADRGIAIVAAQALLFGKPELTIFESAATRAATLEYLAGIVRLCSKLGAGSLVFGSPKNRRIGSLSNEDASPIAVEFFTRLGEIAAAAGTCIVMEANPPVYGADFVTRAPEAIELVERVNHPGFRLHLDTGCMTLANDPIAESFARGGRWLHHFHVSEPNLDPPGTSGAVDHATFSWSLGISSYSDWVSLEMRESQFFDLAAFANSVRWLRSRYGDL